MKKKYALLIYLCWLNLLGSSQVNRIGTWSDYLSYNEVLKVDAYNDLIFGATASGVIVANTADNSFETYSKANGLTSTDVTAMAYNPNTNGLLLGYSNGRLDLITNDRVIAIVDIYNKTIAGNKRINDILVIDQMAFLATGFGIVKYDMAKLEFVDTYIVTTTGNFVNVNQVAIHNDSIYAATDSGIRYAGLNDPNLGYYASWKLDTTVYDPLLSYSHIKSDGNRIFTVITKDSVPSRLLQKNEFGWDSIPNLIGPEITDFDFNSSRFTISHSGFISSYDSNWIEIDRIFDYGEGNFVACNVVKLINETEVIAGDRDKSLIFIPRPFMYNIFQPNTPSSNSFESFDIFDNKVIVAAGGRSANYNNVYSSKGVYFRTNDLNWTTADKWKYPLLDGVFDFIAVKYNKFNPSQSYGGSLGGGLIEFNNNEPVAKYTESNSTLKPASNLAGWVGVTGMDFDAAGNLWVANSRNPQCISVKTVSGVYPKEWYGFSFPGAINDDLTHQLIVDKQNYKWVTLPYQGQGILVFNDNNTIDDTTDDEFTILSSVVGRGGLPSSDIYSIAEDQDGEIWVGTAKGVAVFYSPGAIFQEGANYDAQRIILEAGGYFEYLLSTETVTAIAIDGANRKWLGTAGSGVFLMSAEGTTELHHFTEANSPLLSNNIKEIKINHSTGEVLIGTTNGIISYKSTATANEVNNDAYAYPNPVPSNYDGLIGIKGLPANSPVRITDISGNLVFETISEGTQAVWNGKDMNGNRVATGIYLVIGAQVQGSESKVIKIMISE